MPNVNLEPNGAAHMAFNATNKRILSDFFPLRFKQAANAGVMLLR